MHFLLMVKSQVSLYDELICSYFIMCNSTQLNFSGEMKDAHDSGRKGVDSNNANSRLTQRKSAASKGKVKEFVQIFNQEADVEGSRSSRQGNVGIDPKGINEVSSNPPKVKQQVNLDNVDKKPDVSSKVLASILFIMQDHDFIQRYCLFSISAACL